MGGEAESLLVTGGADARVAVWRDCTAADAAAAAAGAAEAALKAQQLSNALQVRLLCIFDARVTLASGAMSPVSLPGPR